MRGKSADKPRTAKERKWGRLGADRNSAVYTVGGDRSERKGDFLDGGRHVGGFFIILGSTLRNLMGKISQCSMTRRGLTDLGSVTVDVLVGGWNGATFLGAEGGRSL